MTESFPLFRGVKAKLKRARRHLDELSRAIEEYRATGPIHHENVSIDEATGKIAGRTHIDPVPADTSPIIGDVIHNLRSSLDLLASDLVRSRGHQPDDVYFPFSKNEEALAQAIKSRQFDKAGQEAVELLKSFEPYPGGKTALRIIHDLDIQDKHQELIPRPHYNATLAKFSFETRKWTLGDSSEGDLDVIFGKDSPLAGKPVIQTLQALVELTDSVAEAFIALRSSKPENS